jgi:alkanesulfonate monooxygenase SsuD/methylene tetrahydromethanopterin reductase-like flavin-dependent oxidoreductase (luciferase family)
MSGRGRRFACEYADCCFVSTEVSKSDLADYKKIAREEFGREIGIWMQIPLVQRKTRQEAQDHLNYIAVEHEDRLAVDAWSKGVAAESRTVSNEAARFERIVHTMGGRPVVGSAVDIANELEELSARGVDGILFSWFDFDDGLNRFMADVMPLLEQRGLRQKFQPGR